MADRPSRIDNRPVGFIDSKAACDRLGVKPATLYTYVSRGLIRTLRADDGRRRLYLADDVARVAARAEARRGHRAVAIGALRFGEPVLDSAITGVVAGGDAPARVLYRGRDVVELVQQGLPFERVAEWLWAADAEDWPAAPTGPLDRARPLEWRLSGLLGRLALDDPDRHRHALRPNFARARRVVTAFAWGVGARSPGRARASLAARVARGFGRPEAEGDVEAALILTADHELNVSTFTARVAASGGADLYAAVQAALSSFSGPRHGGACRRIAGLLDEIGAPKRARRWTLDRLDRGEAVPGFGHPLYPDGDPRAAPLLARARARPGTARLDALFEVAEVMEAVGPHRMTVDAALVALQEAWRMPPGAATAMFAAGRVAGWIAHVFEQRQSGTLLRPRARYVGPTP